MRAYMPTNEGLPRKEDIVSRQPSRRENWVNLLAQSGRRDWYYCGFKIPYIRFKVEWNMYDTLSEVKIDDNSTYTARDSSSESPIFARPRGSI